MHIEQWSPKEATPDGGWWAVCDQCNDECIYTPRPMEASDE